MMADDVDADERTRCRDRHQAGQAAVQRHADIGLAEQDPGGGRRGERRTAAAVLVVTQMCAIASGIDAHRAARIKAEPAEPQDQAADRGGRHVVAGNGFDLAVGRVLADARAQG